MAEFGKKRNTDHDFLPRFISVENEKSTQRVFFFIFPSKILNIVK